MFNSLLLSLSQHDLHISAHKYFNITTESKYKVNITAYHCISSNRVGRLGGGAGLYLRDNINFNIMSDLCSSNSALFDSVFVETIKLHGKIYCWYSLLPPSHNRHVYLESFQLLLDRVTRDNKVCYTVMDDFNLDLLNTDSHSVTNEFINTLFSHMLYPLILKPKRITSHSATLIDKIFTNNISASSNNSLIINDLSDHLLIFTLSYTEAYSSSNKSKESVSIRNFSSQNINSFNNLLCEFDWNSLIHADANVTYNGFLRKYTEFYNKSFPLKLSEGKSLKTPHNPWLTTGLLKSIKTKSRLYQLFLKRPSYSRA